MKISYNWLREYIDTYASPVELENILIDLGLEVENLEQWQSVSGGLDGFVIGHVLECAKHPNADKLSLTKVNIGHGEPLSIVCGAPNVAAGQKVVVATVGTKIHAKGEVYEIKKTKIRGEQSEGMICAEDEIGLGSAHEGIMVLDPAVKPGILAKDYFKIEEDWIFEIGLTPNRIDSVSHYGVARDLSAYFSQLKVAKLEKPSVSKFKTDNKSLPIEVVVESNEGCKRYSGVTISNITIKESPEWLKNRLRAIGQRPINNVVDITNYVMHELGQPLHAFDADKIKGNKVVVRTMQENTLFLTLDEVERKLHPEDLMICNAEDGMCIAGVFGGIDSGITESTKKLFLESACFNPVWIRKTARRHGLNTDSSFRFERGTDPNNTVYALKRAALLIKELAGGIISSDVVDIYPKPVADYKINVTFKGINSLIGKELSKELIISILKALEIKIEKETSEGLSLSVPPYRVGVKCEADIVEEILRIYGYNNIEFSNKVMSTLTYSDKPEPHVVQNMISDYLSANGFNEIMCNSLTKAAYYDYRDSFKNSIVFIKNPLSSDLNCMRQSLLFGGLESIIHNINHRNQDLKLYEYGNCYFFNKQDNPENQLDQYSENYRLGIFLTGLMEQPNWTTKEEPVTFYHLKTFVNNTIEKAGLDSSKFDVVATGNELLSSGLTYKSGNNIIAEFGNVAKPILDIFDIKQEVFAAEINWALVLKLAKNRKVQYNELPKYPEVRRDLSMIIDATVTYDQLAKLAEKTEHKLLKKINLFDVYQGENIEKGKKSYALSFTLLDEEKTLTDIQIDKVMNNLIKAYETELGALIRK